MGVFDLDAGDVHLSYLPLPHIFERMVQASAKTTRFQLLLHTDTSDALVQYLVQRSLKRRVMVNERLPRFGFYRTAAASALQAILSPRLLRFLFRER